MLDNYEKQAVFFGNTTLFKLKNNKLFSKLAYKNFSCSTEDRALISILYNGTYTGKINEEFTPASSYSGNLSINIAQTPADIGMTGYCCC